MTSTRSSSTFSRSLPVSTERRNSRRPSGRSIPSPIDRQPAPNDQEVPTITDEISEIKRYEDFTTIDWVQDAVYEQSRRRAKRRSGTGFWDQEGILGWRRKVHESYDAGQAWLVVTLVGLAIGLNSAVLNIITEWLSDIKLGHCTTAFYLNENFCCWGAENGMAIFATRLSQSTNGLNYRLPRVEELDFILDVQLCFLSLWRGKLVSEQFQRQGLWTNPCVGISYCSRLLLLSWSSHLHLMPRDLVSPRSNVSLLASS